MKKNLLRNLIACSLAVLVTSTGVIWAQQKQKKELEEPIEKQFNKYQPPLKIMDAIGLKPGMVIGDIGAGGGRFTVWFADRVGETGEVYANDIDMGVLFHLVGRVKWHDFKNVNLRLGTVVDPNIPEGVLDIAFMIDVFHHLEKPVGLVRNLGPALKPGGILVIVESDPEEHPDSGTESTPRGKLLEEVVQAGFELIKIETFLPRDNIYFFRLKK